MTRLGWWLTDAWLCDKIMEFRGDETMMVTAAKPPRGKVKLHDPILGLSK